MTTVTRLTTKYQTTIPAKVRRALGLKAGDRVVFAIKGHKVTIAKAKPGFSEDLAWRLTRSRSMGDWDTPEDEEAFREL